MCARAVQPVQQNRKFPVFWRFLHSKNGSTTRFKVSGLFQRLNNFSSAHFGRIDLIFKYIDEQSHRQKCCLIAHFGEHAVEPLATEKSVAVILLASDEKTEQLDEEAKIPSFPFVEETLRNASDIEYNNSLIKHLAASISELSQHLIPSSLQIKMNVNINLNRQQVDFATVQMQIEHMLKMVEMSGNIIFDAAINIASAP